MVSRLKEVSPDEAEKLLKGEHWNISTVLKR
jgi:hypothetical protein